MSMGARSCEGIVPCDLDQAGEERVARIARSAGKVGERVRAGWTRCELTATNNEAANQQQPFVVFREGTHQVRQELECVRMLFKALGRARRRVAATEHGGVNEEIGQEGCAGRVRHGLQVSAWPSNEGLGGDGSIRALGETGSLGVSGIAKAVDESSRGQTTEAPFGQLPTRSGSAAWSPGEHVAAAATAGLAAATGSPRTWAQR
jgi:hypothetical protein